MSGAIKLLPNQQPPRWLTYFDDTETPTAYFPGNVKIDGVIIEPNQSFINVKAFGAVGDGVTDDTLAVIKADAFAAATGGILFFPNGTYIMDPNHNASFVSEAGVCLVGLPLRSGLAIEMAPNAWMKLKDDVSTAGAPVLVCMIGGNGVYSNVRLDGVGIDMNGANNLIAPTPGGGTLNQAHLFVSGTVAGVAARIDGCWIEGGRYINTAGKNCITMMQSNTNGVILGQDWVVRGNLFKNNGLNTADHSSIFGWTNNAKVTENWFYQDVQFNGAGGNVSYEVHGADCVFAHNSVYQYFQGMWIDGNGTSSVERTLIQGNIFNAMGAFGICFFGQSAAVVNNTDILDNVVAFDNSIQAGIDLKTAYQINTAYGQQNIRVLRNKTISGQVNAASTAVAGVYIGGFGGVAAQIQTNIIVEDNKCYGGLVGVNVSSTANMAIGIVQVNRNFHYNPSTNAAFMFPEGINIDGSLGAGIANLAMNDNQCIDDRGGGAQAQWGIVVRGTVGILSRSGNIATNMVQAAYAEVGAVITRRTGNYTFTDAWTPANVNPTTTAEQAFAFAGVAVGDVVTVTPPGATAGVLVGQARVSSAGNISVDFANVTAGALAPPSGNYQFQVQAAA